MKKRAAINELRQKLDLQIADKKWELALKTMQKMIDDYKYTSVHLKKVLNHFHPTDEQLQEMMNDPSSMYLAGLHLMSMYRPEGYTLVKKAAEAGHVLAKVMVGYCTFGGYYGYVQINEKLAIQMYKETLQYECVDATGVLCDIYLRKQKYKKAANMLLLGYMWGRQEALEQLQKLLARYPKECCPFGEWKPTFLVHSLVPKNIADAMEHTYCIMRLHFRLPKYVCNLILFWICTK